MIDYQDKFDDLNELPISEELLGAYIEGNISEGEAARIESNLSLDDFFHDLMTDAYEIHTSEPFDNNEIDLENLDNDNFDFELPPIFSNEILNEDMSNLSYPSTIYEARKQYGLEPLNIDFDPDTYQWENDTCAIRSQEIVLRSFGTFVSQDELIDQAESHGWYSPGCGTPMECVGNLLDLYNVPNHRVANANVFNLADELGQGHKVIVGVDIDELYGNSFWHSIKDCLIGKTPNHALLVSGLDTSDPHCSQVTLTDPGTGKTLFECPYDRFLSAWNDSGCFMVATDNPAPLQYNAESMINFDYSKGHVASLGSIPYEDFHNHVVPGVENYIDSIDEYIASLEKAMDEGFSLESFTEMMEKSGASHQKALDIISHNLGSSLEKGFNNNKPDDMETHGHDDEQNPSKDHVTTYEYDDDEDEGDTLDGDDNIY